LLLNLNHKTTDSSKN